MIPRFAYRNDKHSPCFGVLFRGFSLLLVVFLAACQSVIDNVASPPPGTAQVVEASTPTATMPPTPTLTPTPAQYPWSDENAVMSGLCFESVYDAAGRIFALRSVEQLTAFYDLADNSELCRRPVERGSFDFSGGRLLLGTWSRASGCTARHEVVDIRRDDVARIYAIEVRLVAEGGCDYELARPFWIGLNDLTGYDIRLVVR